MQAIKEKLNGMTSMHKAKAEAKEEEKAEKEIAKVQVEVAHEVRQAREAEAAMDLHVQKAAIKAVEHIIEHPLDTSGHHQNYGEDGQEAYGRNPTNRGSYSH
ncbi:late embryogenesis abundant protein 18-like [Forsythia ovata]|uniref:Late embryogenesis abundant protein 18-like n=1 Tax=Forsythia ovata TaxID=205694 RepID=A0ABD1TMW5_9LAMI